MEEEQIKNLILFLKGKGLRITPQRMQILTAVFLFEGHPTVEDIQKEIPIISLATIYNNLKLFVELGIIDELPYGNGISRYEFYKTNHYHVICESCGKIADLNFPALTEVEEIASNITGYKIQKHHMEVYGLCPKCHEKS
ncbi:Fur family transcriptional regulator [Cytobacillus purgationiresistens]|uniref:Fur family peroxide stress response transcriptional regulator n=1 Tax=Cytobacillus purgationiresistens TaxID=863449 RepID=A0ABU0AEE8_9BACI|nr:Fur family transcriptional regulator [Cytobacillus purgationiresistens]MDQ0269623.1 Fur family peroxide stress response transcriptional regulator [Cytobacillus purgationiresistens]